SRCPLIAGLGTDVAGARAAIGLAERIGGAVDHMNSAVLLRDLAVVREAGLMLTTPSEARAGGGMVLRGRPGLGQESAEIADWSHGEPARSTVWLCPGRAAKHNAIKSIGRDPAQLPILLAALRARLAGRPAGKIDVPAKAIDDLATQLKAARFGVAVWSAAGLDALVIEMLCGIVADLNADTRFSGFSLAPGDNAIGALQACGWMTGFPMRTGFGRGFPEHDPWRFDGARLAAAHETDCVLWISAYRTAMPEWKASAPTIALTTGDAIPRPRPAVQIEVG